MNVHSFFSCTFVLSKKGRMNSFADKIWSVVVIIMAIFMFYGGVQHFSNSAFYIPFVPDFLPFKIAMIYFSGAIEIAIAVLLVVKKYRGIGALSLLVLMLVFLPIHVWDVFLDTPAIGSHQLALIRLPIQLAFIGIAWKLKNLYFNKK